MKIGHTGILLTEPKDQAHWVRVTDIDTTKTPPRHAVEVYRDPSAGIDAYEWATRPGGLRLELPESWAVETMGGAAAVDDVVLVRKDAAGLWTFALGGGASTSVLVVLTGRDYSGDFISYSTVEVEATGSVTYAVKSGGREFSPGGTALYHERNLDLPPVHATAGVPDFVNSLSVVRAHEGPDGKW
jgi:hypothetical protein